MSRDEKSGILKIPDFYTLDEVTPTIKGRRKDD
jgi:hypothetical protein